MAVQFTARIPTVEYGYFEVATDTFDEFVEAVASAQDFAGQGGTANTGADEAQQQGINALKRGGINPRPTGFRGPNKGGFGNSQKSQPEKVELGEFDGYKLTLNTKGQYGPYVNAYNPDTKDRINANLDKGEDVSKVDLNRAIELVSAAVSKEG